MMTGSVSGSAVKKIHPVDQMLPWPRLLTLGVQHVLVMYANAVAAPLILGAAMHLDQAHIAMLINADLFACGIATLIQTIGFGPFGIRLPVIMGVTGLCIPPMLAMAATPGVGLQGIYGAALVGGLFGLAIVPLIGRMLRFFPALVTGSIIMMIGISLMRIGINWAAGGVGAADYGSFHHISASVVVLLTILLLVRFARGFLSHVAVMAGLLMGYMLTILRGDVDFSGLAAEPWMRVVTPLQFGMPSFHLIPCLTMCLLVTITFIEATGMFMALGSVVGKPVSDEDIRRGLRADGLGTVIGAVFNTFPYVSYSQNVGMVGITGVFSRYVCVASGVIMLALGLVPKLAFIVATIPYSVLGGAAFIMFGMVAATGIKILATVDYRTEHNAVLVVALSVGLGVIPLVAPDFFRMLPAAWRPVVADPIVLTAVSAVLLNAFFSRATRLRQTKTEQRLMAVPFAATEHPSEPVRL
ncbi:nucleobase:cation symporter-2 family protein [Granulibacter bethesdensis]|uniref:nucleobase:cation symporter-2 family protein n=1 Tax=Granulibacter bethesdensis TaxID=364410 RepID=UPI00090CC9C0|nr:nucleobase:cation symporter-2 family protein [Granulibacter bethesdensis]APH59983.1 Xanthine permease [Granulibacter bethesdensis]